MMRARQHVIESLLFIQAYPLTLSLSSSLFILSLPLCTPTVYLCLLGADTFEFSHLDCWIENKGRRS